MAVALAYALRPLFEFHQIRQMSNKVFEVEHGAQHVQIDRTQLNLSSQ